MQRIPSEQQPADETTFGGKLRQLRDAAGLTQERLAERAGLTAKAISQLERGERRHPYPHTLETLAAALGLRAHERAALFAAVPRRGTVARAVAQPAPAVPVPLTPLFGRDAELAALGQLVLRGDVRCVTVVGPGGVGKTRLVLELIADLTERFADGIAFVALASLSDPALVIPAIAAALDVREAAGHAVREVLHAFLRARRLLLVLDNFEHVTAAAVEVSTLLAACPQLSVLVTSRAPLRIQGEQEYPLAPLAVPALDRVARVADVAASPAVRLFVARAQAVAPAFELKEANATTIAAICRRLDGLPLALELAAARSKLLPLTALLARLDRVLPLLVGGAHDLPQRQQTLRHTVAWSYGLLTAAEQQLFRRLAVFAGGWTLDATAAVCDRGDESDEILDRLQSLLDNSLIVRTEGDEPRWQQLETIRAYGLEQLERSGEAEGVRSRHAAFFLSLALEAETGLLFAQQAAWLDRLEQEHDNLRAALAWLLDTERIHDAVQIAWALYRFWSIRGYLSEGRQWLEAALAAGATLSAASRARALAVDGALAFQQHDLVCAADLLDRALRLSAGGDAEVHMLTLQTRGHVAIEQEAYAQAAAYFAQALQQAWIVRAQWAIGLARTGAGYVALHQGQVAEALVQLQAGEAELRACSAHWYLALNLNMQAGITLPRAEYARSEVLLRESIEISQRLRDTWALPFALDGMAAIALAQGQARRAACLFGATEVLREPLGNTIGNVVWRTVYQQHVGALHGMLDAETLAAAWAEGRTMRPEQAIALALESPTT